MKTILRSGVDIKVALGVASKQTGSPGPATRITFRQKIKVFIYPMLQMLFQSLPPFLKPVAFRAWRFLKKVLRN